MVKYIEFPYGIEEIPHWHPNIMLVQFTLSNWKSFRDPVTFSLIASRERQHGKRLARLDKHQIRILPIAALYGGNASGKTNLCDALAFAQRLVCTVTKPRQKLPVEPFLLDDNSVKHPSRFAFEILVDEDLYEFSFALTRNEIREEKLVKITSAREQILYDRRNGEPNFHRSLEQDPLLQFAFRGTRANQLFLTNSVSQTVEAFRPVYDWFEDSLTIITPPVKRCAHVSTGGSSLVGEYRQSAGRVGYRYRAMG